MFLGADSLIQSVGIGSLRPNTLLMGFKKDWRTAEPESVKHYSEGGAGPGKKNNKYTGSAPVLDSYRIGDSG